jgi:hypothetical protein
MKLIIVWTIGISVCVWAGLLALAAYASVFGSLELVAMTYGLMALVAIAVTGSLLFMAPREAALSREWILSTVITTPVGLLFVTMIMYRAVACVFFDPAFLFSTVLVFCVSTSLSPLIILPTPLKIRIPAALVGMLVIVLPGFRLSDPWGPRQDVHRPRVEGAASPFFAGAPGSQRAILQAIRPSTVLPGRYDHVWLSYGDGRVIERNFGPSDEYATMVDFDTDEMLIAFDSLVDGLQLLRFDSKLNDLSMTSADDEGGGGANPWTLTNVERDLKNGQSFLGFHDLLAHNMETGEVAHFEGMHTRHVAGWADEGTILAVRRIIVEDVKLVQLPSDDPDKLGEWTYTSGRSEVQLLHLDLNTGEESVVQSIELEEVVTIVVPNGPRGVMFSGSEGDSHPLRYLDWESGKVRTLVEDIHQHTMGLVMNEESIVFACEGKLSDGTRRVVVGTHKEVTGAMPLDGGAKAVFAYPSPDGRRVYFATVETIWDEGFLDSSGVASVWDLDRAEVVPLVRRGPLATLYDNEALFSPVSFPYPGTLYSPWSADGRQIVFLFRESTGYNLQRRRRMHVVHYGDWAER